MKEVFKIQQDSEEVFKIQQDSEEVFKIQQDSEEVFKIQQEREREGGIQSPARERARRRYSKSSKSGVGGKRAYDVYDDV